MLKRRVGIKRICITFNPLRRRAVFGYWTAMKEIERLELKISVSDVNADRIFNH